MRNCLFFGNSLEFFWNLMEIFLNFFWNSSEGFFLEEFFWWNFFEGIFWEKFVSGIFFEGFFGGIFLGWFLEGLLFLEKFFSMNYLFYFNVEGNWFVRQDFGFCQDFVWKQKKGRKEDEFRSLEEVRLQVHCT